MRVTTVTCDRCNVEMTEKDKYRAVKYEIWLIDGENDLKLKVFPFLDKLRDVCEPCQESIINKLTSHLANIK